VAIAGGRLWLEWYVRANADPRFFADDIAAVAEADQEHPPPDSPIVFTGSSSIRLWTSLQEDMAPMTVLNRGFGGSRISSAVFYADQLVTRYHPRAVVLYAGDNDLDERTGKTAEDIAQDFQAFVARVQAGAPGVRIYFVSIKPSRLRRADWSRQAQANALIAAICAADPQLGYIDIATPMLATGEPPSRELFRFDGLHLSEKGYAMWTQVIRPRLERDLGEPDAASQDNAVID
jgi:lysophospholipase L1-like esterase